MTKLIKKPIKMKIKHICMMKDQAHIHRVVEEIRQIEKENQCSYIDIYGDITMADDDLERIIEHTKEQ